MKKILFIFIFIFSFISVFGDVMYIAPSTASPAGSNSNSGTISSPWLSLSYAWDQATAGDTIYVRGGTYTYAMLGESYLDNKDGTSSAYIYILNYPGESPVFNYAAYLTTTYRRGIRLDNAEYVYLRGIEIKNLRQAADGRSTNTGIYVTNNVNHVIVENMNVHHIGGWGLQFGNCNYITFTNCDFHRNSDPKSVGSTPFDGGDGVQSASANVSYIVFEGCRFYKNGDDGVDLLWVGGHVSFINCWSFQNGFRPGETDADADQMTTAGGNGEGFKLGFKASPSVATVLRRVTGCVAAQNRLLGFHHYVDIADGEYEFSCEIYNNTAYNNGVSGYDGGGFNFGSLSIAQDILRNNLCYNDQVFVNAVHSSTYNSWNTPPGVTLSSADFVSLDYTQLETARNADHSLPTIDFMHLVEGSDCINAGVDIGLDYIGSAPDLGAFEYGTAEPEPEPEPEEPYSPVSRGRFNKFNGKYFKHNSKYFKW